MRHCTPSASGGRFLRALPQLALVFSGVEPAFRLRDQSIVACPPGLEAADPNFVAGAARPRVRSDQRPMELGAVSVQTKFVHQDLHVRKRCHERSSNIGDRRPSHSGRVIVHLERASRSKKRGNSLRILAAPGSSIARAKFTELGQILGHYASSGCFLCQSVCDWKVCAASTTLASSSVRPMNWRLTGKLCWPKPHGTLIAGRPQKLPMPPMGSANVSARSRLASSFEAVTGSEGVAKTSTRVKISSIFLCRTVRMRWARMKSDALISSFM